MKMDVAEDEPASRVWRAPLSSSSSSTLVSGSTSQQKTRHIGQRKSRALQVRILSVLVHTRGWQKSSCFWFCAATTFTQHIERAVCSDLNECSGHLNPCSELHI
jgi:hypothetical protein